MYKYKKLFINLITLLYMVLFVIELIIYLNTYNNIFGVFYLLINLVIIFFLVPCAHNYKKYYSVARISKLIIVILLGIFSSYILELIIPGIFNYSDSSLTYIDKVFLYKYVLKGVLYLMLTLFTIFEFKSEKVFSNKENAKHLDF